MIERLLGSLSKHDFLERHFHKLPHSCQGGSRELASLGTWEVVEQILATPEADAMAVRSGRQWEEGRSPNYEEARELFANGYTILIRHAERYHAGLEELARGFSADFLAPTDVHLYCTPASQFGFGWHYDAEDVFILQTLGEKEYSLRKNTVNPWPLVETLPADMRFEREIMPLMRCQLSAGDWLYIPNGYWHKAEASADSISLAMGVMSTAALDVLDFLRQELLESLLWRQRLPLDVATELTERGQLAEHHQSLFTQLGDDLQRLLQNPNFARRFAEHWRTRFGAEER